MYSQEDLKKAAEYRAEIHEEALAKVRAVCPCAEDVEDNYAASDYFQQMWDYPGQWYTIVGTPPGAGSRKDLVNAIVRQTITHYRDAGADFSDDAFYRLLAQYPAVGCEFCLVNADTKADGALPYSGVTSHRRALEYAESALLSREKKLPCDIRQARCRKLGGKALFAPVQSDQWLNYRKAFLCPPRGNGYTDNDFEKLNAVLFPCGTDTLEIYRWTQAHAKDTAQNALCLSIYDKVLERFVIITASPRD